MLIIFSSLRSGEIFVESGEDIRAAINSAQSGDVIVLENGGVYEVEDIPNVVTGIDLADMHLTIKAEDGATIKPEVTLNGFDLDNTDNALELRGIRFISNGGNYFINFVETFQYALYVKVLDCDVEGFPRCAIRGNRGSVSTCDELIFDNCTFYGFDDSYRFFHFADLLDFTIFKFTNSTVSGFTEAFLWAYSLSYKEIDIDNCTFNDLSIVKNYFINVDGATGSYIKITDCLFTNFVAGPLWSIWPADTLEHCRFFNVGDTSNTWDYVNDFFEYDPQYADPENLDFTLPPDSPLLTAGTDGGPIGDPRWIGTSSAIGSDPLYIPSVNTLEQNYPNPFNPLTNIEFQLVKPGYVTLEVYNMLGQKVANLAARHFKSGRHRVVFDAGNLVSGVYYYKITTGDFIQIKKMMLLK